MRALLTRDEREQSVDLAADRLAFVVLAFGILLDVMYRSFVLGEASWDLIGLVIVAGAAGFAVRWHAGVASPVWLAVRFATVVVAAVLAAVLVIALASR